MSSPRQVLAYFLTLSMVAAPLLLGGVLRAQETTTLATSAADATLDQANPGTNFGTGGTVGTSGGTGVVQRSVVRFDLSTLANAGVAVKAATLTMTLTDPPSSSRTIEVHNLTTPFAENTVTYSSPWGTAGGDFGASLITHVSGTTRGGTVSWADSGGVLAAAVQGWFTSNTGFLLKDASEGSNSPPGITVAEHVQGTTNGATSVTTSSSITAEVGDVYLAAIADSNVGLSSVTGVMGRSGSGGRYRHLYQRRLQAQDRPRLPAEHAVARRPREENKPPRNARSGVVAIWQRAKFIPRA